MALISPKQIDWSQPISGSLLPYVTGSTTSVFNIGSPSQSWGSVYVGNTQISGSISAGSSEFETIKVSQRADFTGSLNLSGSFFLDNENIRVLIRNNGIFAKTGSYFSATQEIHITGSLKLNFDGIQDYFRVAVNGEEKLRINEEGILVLIPQQLPPTPVTGGIYYDINNAFYLGQ